MRQARYSPGGSHVFWISLALAAGAAVTGCSRPADTAAHATTASRGVRFTDGTEAAGIHFRHTSGRSGRFYLPETLGSGCAFLDTNNDGRLDLFLVNGSRLPGCAEKGPFYSALYRNDGSGHFTDVTKEAGLAVDCYGLGVAVADYDGDGFQDLYLTAMGPNHLFHNNGHGTFTDVTKRAGVADPRFSTCAAWLDRGAGEAPADGALLRNSRHGAGGARPRRQDPLGRRLCAPERCDGARPPRTLPPRQRRSPPRPSPAPPGHRAPPRRHGCAARARRGGAVVGAEGGVSVDVEGDAAVRHRLSRMHGQEGIPRSLTKSEAVAECLPGRESLRDHRSEEPWTCCKY